MSQLYCPKCGAECEGDAPNKPWYLYCECECGFEFGYNMIQEEYTDMDGNLIKEDTSVNK